MHVHATIIAPSVEIKTNVAIVTDAIGMHNVEIKFDQALQDVRRIFDNIDVQPQDPIRVAQRTEQHVVSCPRQDCPSLRLVDFCEAWNSVWHCKTEVFLEKPLTSETFA